MRSVFWVSLCIIGYTYVGYPCLIYLLARFRPRPWRRSPSDLSVSIVMAVHNGGLLLEDKIRHLASLDPSHVREIIIVSDGSTDNSTQILNSVQDARIRPILLKEHGGKAVALNHGIAAASGDILLFIDIRPRIAPGALTALLNNFADPTVGCAAGELKLDSRDNDPTSKAVGGMYWRYEQWIRDCEAAFDSPVGVYGGFYAIRRSLITPFPPGLILDDMFQPLALIRKGYRSILDRTACVVDHWPSTTGGEFQRKVRTLAGNYQLVALQPWVLSPRNRVLFQLVSHKLLRLVVPYCFLLLLGSATWLGFGTTSWKFIASIEWLGWLLSALSLRVSVPFIGRAASASGALLMLNIAAVAGLYKWLFTRGPLWKIWTIPQSGVTATMVSPAQPENAL